MGGAVGSGEEIPLTYTGNMLLSYDEQEKQWNYKLLSSGTLEFTRDSVIDLFLVGGGGGSRPGVTGFLYGAAGGGGYTKNVYGVSIPAGQPCQVQIGAGGLHSVYVSAQDSDNATDGGETSVTVGEDVYTAPGGKCAKRSATPGKETDAGDGGSGGAGVLGQGGTDGEDGTTKYPEYTNPGKGQGSTTRAFETGALYASGGSSSEEKEEAVENSGNGGWAHPSDKTGTNGADGIVIVRMHHS